MRNSQAIGFLTAVAVATLAVSAGAATPKGSFSPVPKNIPTGPADENSVTSTAMTAILNNCVAAYSNGKALHAVGTLVNVTKSHTSKTSYTQAALTFDYLRPDKLAVLSRSDTRSLNGAFFANGTTVTMMSSIYNQFLAIPQPKSLAAFVDIHRAGEHYGDLSNVLGLSTISQMAISEDPHSIMFEGIERFIFEGGDKVGDADCYRVRFVQDHPQVIVILWIDKSSFLIRKSSFIRSYDKDINFIESFEKGSYANMRVIEWKSLSTDPAKIDSSAFAAKIPVGYTDKSKHRDKATTATKTSGEDFWSSLISVAAKTSTEETTWSLKRQMGDIDLKLGEFAELPESIYDCNSGAILDGKPVLAVATNDGVFTMRDSAREVLTTVSLNKKFDAFDMLNSSTSGPLILVVSEDQAHLSAYDIHGRRQWTYSPPYTKIGFVSTTKTGNEKSIYVALDIGDGVRKLDENGKVVFSYSNVSLVDMIKPAASGTDRVVYLGLYSIGVFDKKLNLLNRFDTEEFVTNLIWDETEPTKPIIDLGYSSQYDALLQRRSPTGDVVWTTMIAPDAKDDQSGGFIRWIRVKVGDSVQRCIFTMLVDGEIVITSTDGKVLYRGQVSANNALVARNGDQVLSNIALDDLDGDGVDEVYTRIDNHLLVMTTN